MTNLRILKGNIFTSTANVLVNTVNCVGVMGAGIALEFRLRYPKMYLEYVELCKNHKINIGSLWLYKSEKKWILNFPTKTDWKYPSKESYLHEGLKYFIEHYNMHGIQSVAFPLLGAQKGGLDPKRSLEIMSSYLANLSIPVEIYEYDSKASDDIYLKFKLEFSKMNDQDLALHSGLRSNYLTLIRNALSDPSICQLNQLAKVQGIGDKTLEKAFAFITNDKENVQIGFDY
jgi:O-acetyl-ADP-ribose deacetylase (regulator of RNase III)